MKNIKLSDYPWADCIGIDKIGLWAEFVVHGETGQVRQRMRWIKPGSFMMGSPKDEPGRFSNEGPQHQVTISKGYWMFDTPVTQALWVAVMRENHSSFKSSDCPVDKVSWDDCQKFLQKINDKIPGLELILPSEAQWEYACRAGTSTPFSFGANITPEYVNYDGNYPYTDSEKGEYRKETVDVKDLPCNDWGLYQMHGNVLEWCRDWFGDYPDEPVIDPLGSDSGRGRVCRGGFWFSYAGDCRSASRDWLDPDERDDDIGFRCVMA